MAWTDVIDQERAVTTLRRALAHERIAHAYLFHGAHGVGKRAVALALAQALQCTTDGPNACGACKPCRKVARMVHPDVHVLFPYPKGTDEEDIGARIRRLGEDPYAAIDYVRRPSLSDPSQTSNKQVMYHIDRVHDDLIRPMSFKPLEGRYQVALLTDVEHMNESAANAFLKLLEEPPPRTVFILTTSRPDQLLPTILSRCQQLRFDALAPEAIGSALIEREDIDSDRAAMLARMADGSYSYALDLAENEELMESRALVLEFFRAAYTQRIDPLDDLINRIASMGRERVKGMLRLMLRWIRDLMLYRTMGDDAPLVNVDQREAAARFCDNLPDAELTVMVQLVEEAVELVGGNVRLGLVLRTLATQLSRAMRGDANARLFVPLPEASLRGVA
jgi:DNA polymerase-3 subunit delta'